MWVGNMQKGIIHCLQSMKARDNSSLRGDTSVEVQECAALNDVTLCNDSWYLHPCSGSCVHCFTFSFLCIIFRVTYPAYKTQFKCAMYTASLILSLKCLGMWSNLILYLPIQYYYFFSVNDATIFSSCLDYILAVIINV